MEEILSNIHNIDDTHVSDHHLQDVECSRPDTFNSKAYEAARVNYEQRMAEYNKTNLFKRLFISKPLEPNPADFMFIW